MVRESCNHATRRGVIRTLGATSLIGLAGCVGELGGDSSGGDTPTETSGTTVGSTDSSEWGDWSGETLHFVTEESGDASQNFWNRVARDFEEETGASTRMEYTGFGTAGNQRIVQLVQSGQAPDVSQTNFADVSTYTSLDILEPVTDVVEDYIVPELGELNEGAQFTPYGEYYNVPFWVNIGCYFHREDFLAEVDMEAPDTWDDVLEYAEKTDGIREGVRGSYVAAGSGAHATHQLISWFYSNKGQVIERDSNGDLKVAIESGTMRKRLVETLEFLRDLHEFSPAATDSTWDTLASSMAQGTAASQWYIGFRPPVRSFNADQPFAEDVRLSPQPTSPQGGRTARGGSDGISIFKGGNTEMAKRFIAFAMQPKYLLDLYMSMAPVHNIPAYPKYQQGSEYQDALKETPYNQEDIEAYQVDVASDWKSFPSETTPPNPYVGAVFGQAPLWDINTEVLALGEDIDTAIDKYAPQIQENLDEAASQ